MAVFGTCFALVLLGLWEAWQLWREPRSDLQDVIWTIDPLFVSGCLTVLFGLWLARGRRERFSEMLASLGDRETLVVANNPSSERRPLSADQWKTLTTSIQTSETYWSIACAGAIGLGMAAVWVFVARRTEGVLTVTIGPLVALVAGALVGLPLGRMLSHGLRFSHRLDEAVATLKPRRGHVDGAGGLKPLGHFFVSQTLLMLLPAVFLIVWTVILFVPYWAGTSDPCGQVSVSTVATCVGGQYPHWRWAYFGLSVLAIALAALAAGPAFLRAHRDMKSERALEVQEADRVYSEVASKLKVTTDVLAAPPLQDELAICAERWREAEAMPAWPFDSRLRRRLLGVGALAATPLVSQLIGVAIKNFFPD